MKGFSVRASERQKYGLINRLFEIAVKSQYSAQADIEKVVQEISGKVINATNEHVSHVDSEYNRLNDEIHGKFTK